MNLIVKCYHKFNLYYFITFIAIITLYINDTKITLKGSYDVISSFLFSLECYKLFVHR